MIIVINENDYHYQILGVIMKSWKAITNLLLSSSLIIAAGCSKVANNASNEDSKDTETKSQSPVEVAVTDYTFDTAGNMFAYSEFELSGEPLVESLGLDLDVLDPIKVDQPTKFDYTAGIESYEYSEESMYEVVEKSGLGLHLINGPIVKASANGTSAAEYLGNRFYQLAEAVGYPKEQIFQNMFPTFIEYASGDPHYITKVNTEEYAANDDGTYVPQYQVDFSSLRWDREAMDKILNPAAYGSVFLKQALWAGDFMGGFHTVDGDEELEGETPQDDQDPNIALGVSSADGFQGAILTEEIWNKVNYIRDHLFYSAAEGKLVSAGIGSAYNPEIGYIYLPHEIEVKEIQNHGAPDAQALTVKDSKSVLRDQWLMLWPSAEFFGMTDQRPENKNVAPSFRALFDGDPYPKAPAENVDSDANNDILSKDPYSVNRDVIMHIFKNMEAMHFNEQEGTFVTEHDGKNQGKYVSTFDAGYTMEALRIFQRAIDGLPVGYASGEDAQGLQTDEGQKALHLIQKQADFIINQLKLESGLVANGYTIGEGQDKEVTLEAQLGAIRGLTAAYLATKDEKYRDEARSIYEAMNKELFNDDANVFETKEGEMKYNPFTAGALSAVFRIALTNLSNVETDENQSAALEKENIIEKYVSFYDTVIDGPSLTEGMQVSEFWDTGDFYKKDDESGNTDHDNVPQIQAGHGENGIAPILVPVEITFKKES